VDIAIVGAGPAGARAARVLAARGARVTIFDASHPREKPCGGGVTGRALALVADAIDPTAVPQTAIRSVRLRAHGASTGQARVHALRLRAQPCRKHPESFTPLSHADATVPLDGNAIVVANRATFDAALLSAAERAGAVLNRSRVTGVTIDREGVSIETRRGRYRAGFLIGADGANSLVRRRVAGAFRRDQLSLATGFFAHGVTSDEIVVELTTNPAGYIWSFPRPTHLAIGICTQADTHATAASLRAMTAAWIAATAIAPGARLEPYSWPIPSLSAQDFGTLAPAGARWALIGDAAGLVDPITREGIFFALASGTWIADALTAAAPDREYASRVHDEAVSELTRAARLKAGFFRPAFTGLLVSALERSGAIRAVMADLVAGRQSYATLKRRLLGTLEWRLALKVLATGLGSD
jgi:flavin-dependent dehydrogenase